MTTIPGGSVLTAGGVAGASDHVNGPVPVRISRSIGKLKGAPADALGSSPSKLPSTSGSGAPAGAMTSPMAGLFSTRPPASVTTGTMPKNPVSEVVPDNTPFEFKFRPAGRGLNGD